MHYFLVSCEKLVNACQQIAPYPFFPLIFCSRFVDESCKSLVKLFASVVNRLFAPLPHFYLAGGSYVTTWEWQFSPLTPGIDEKVYSFSSNKWFSLLKSVNFWLSIRPRSHTLFGLGFWEYYIQDISLHFASSLSIFPVWLFRKRGVLLSEKMTQVTRWVLDWYS